MATLVLALVLLGCGSQPPSTAPAPAPAAPATWQAPLPAAPIPNAGATAATSARLDQALDDNELRPLQLAARAASPDLAAALARIERSRALRVAAGAAEQPRLDASTSVQRGRAVAGGPAATSAHVGIQAGWELDLFGARRAASDAAQARFVASTAQHEAASRALDAEVASSLLALRSCVAQRELAAADSHSRAEIARLTELRERAGFAAPADAALARGSAAQGRAALVAQRAACEQQLKAMVQLTGLDEQALRARRLLAPLPLAAIATGSPASSAVSSSSGSFSSPGWPTLPVLPRGRAIAIHMLPAELLNQRPDLREAAAAVLAAAAETRGAMAAQHPQLTLAGSIGLGATRSAGVSLDGNTWAIGPLQLSVPLFDGGARRANANAARAEYDAAVATLHAALRRAVREVEQALVTLAANSEREADATNAAQSFDAVLRATEQRQRGGLASLFELEDARRSALAAQSALIELQRERAQAWIDLSRALGGA